MAEGQGPDKQHVSPPLVLAETTNTGSQQETIEFKNPHDLPLWRKLVMTVFLAGLTFTVTFASSVFSSALDQTAKEFHTTETVMILGVSLYVAGFAVGPLFWGPLSESVGRRIPLFTGYLVFGLMQVPTALARSLPGLLVPRFLAGAFGSATLALVTATYADFWGVAARGTASAVYSTTVFMGPTFGPVVGVYITEDLGWRWTAWITGIMALIFGIPAFLFVPETYAPVLKGQPKPALGAFLTKYLVRPLKMTQHEILLNVMNAYAALVYGIQYLSFYAIPYIFRHRGWPAQTASLPFLAFLLGITTAAVSVSIFYRRWLHPRYVARGRVLPEDRLPPIIVGSFLLPIGLFWIAWTSSAHWIAQVIPIYFFGAGIMLVFSVCNVYLIDVYLPVSASALATNGALRSAVAAGLPLAAPSMYAALGVGWATSLLGFCTTLLIPAPLIFYKYGERLRQTSKFAVGSIVET